MNSCKEPRDSGIPIFSNLQGKHVLENQAAREIGDNISVRLRELKGNDFWFELKKKIEVSRNRDSTFCMKKIPLNVRKSQNILRFLISEKSATK